MAEEPAQLLVMIEGAIADPFRVILPLTHVAGASDATEQPNAPSVSFEWLGPLSFNYGDTVYAITVGARIGLVLDQAGGGIWQDVWDPLWSPALPVGTTPIPTITRFTGRITDVEAAANTETLRSKITAVGTSAEAASYTVGRLARPAETETQRVAAWNSQAPYVVVNYGGAIGYVARDPEPTGLIDALHATAESTGARVVEDGFGRIVYIGLDKRRAATEAAHLTLFDVLVPVGWAQHVAGLLNDVRVFYGPPAVAPAVERANVVRSSGDSISKYGRQSIDIETELSTEDDALSFGGIVLSHWAQAYWDAPLISVPAHLLSDATWAAVMKAELGQILTTDGVTSTPATPAGVGRWLIEGFSQSWDRDDFGSLTDDLQFAVSELERWIADGKTDTITTAVAAPTSAPYLSPITITATVKTGGVGIPAGGVVEVYEGVTLLGTGSTNASGVATISVKPTVGTHRLTVTFVGNASLRTSSGSVSVTVTPVTVVTVTLTNLPSTGREGEAEKLEATVSPVGATGSIRWQYQIDGAAFADWSGHDSPVSATTGKASASWAPGNGNVYVWRARYDPTPGSPFSTATSGTDTITIQHKTTQTIVYSAGYAASYQQDGDKRSDTSDLYQGYYSGTNGNQKSMAGFAAISPDWAGATITKVEAYFYFEHWTPAGGGTAVIGSYTGGSEPGSWPSSGVDSNRSSAAFDRGEGKYVNITSWGKGFATGSLRALVLGPGPSTAGGYYGYATGTGSNRPKLRITGEVWS